MQREEGKEGNPEEVLHTENAGSSISCPAYQEKNENLLD